FPFEDINDFNIRMDQEHELFRKSIRQFCEDKLSPIIMDVERTNDIPKGVIDDAKKLGLTGIGIPQEYGGQGGDMRMQVIMSEEISRVLPSFGTMLLVNHLFVDPLIIFGTEEQKSRYVVPVATGKALAAHASTEPGAGSDVAGISTTAKKVETGWVLNGRKAFITNADRADFFLASARTSPINPQSRWRGLSTFIVERSFNGLEIGHKFDVIGLRGEQPNEVIFNNVTVPEANLVGKPNEGFKVVVTTYDYSRILIAAQAVGIAQAAFEMAFNYSTQRNAFEKPIASFEGVAFKISDMLMELEAARLLTYWAAYLADTKKEFYMASSIAKTYSTETAEKLASLAIKIHGGAGVDRDTGVERFLRDSVITTIYEGANDIQRLTIFRSLLKMVSKNLEVS
ncbi:MAG: acyl-CoA dehydrogenase family protein, partial [Conexivisphaerales archaeon]